MTDESGKLWMASSVAPGATVEMQAADDDARSRWRATLSENGLDPITGGGSSSSYGRYSPYEYEGDYPDYYNRSDQEQFMKSLLSSSQAIHGHMRSYCAILGADPDLDLGYDRARPRESLHLKNLVLPLASQCMGRIMIIVSRRRLTGGRSEVMISLDM